MTKEPGIFEIKNYIKHLPWSERMTFFFDPMFIIKTSFIATFFMMTAIIISTIALFMIVGYSRFGIDSMLLIGFPLTMIITGGGIYYIYRKTKKNMLNKLIVKGLYKPE